MVSLDEQTQFEAKQLFDGMNEILSDLGIPQLTRREEVEAVFYLVIRKHDAAGLIWGATTKAGLFQAVLNMLVLNGVISPEFAAAVFSTWMRVDNVK